ncbi:tripartite tricarboxylate transporter substrate binding protein [Motiliproteus sediminis]|uniref:tripartite tricarboxylate transporter substrate binding protein n=1 Tax=Motiliproteus sediminis TaxID=1468178 RepID=UPI001AEFDF9C|nr:tripartite tricarboxylate transporter substrate-binding protein [Motiliproteus sediminis]
MLSKLLARRRSTLMATALVSCLGAGMAQAAVDSVHFLIPGGAGGGWDGTARGTGEALSKSGLVSTISYENMSGGGGGKAIAHLIEVAEQAQDTLMVNSTPIVIRSLSKVFPQSFRDLTPVAATIGDFGAFVVAKDSKYTSFKQMADDYLANPRSVTVAGGSARGSMDHLVAAMAFKAAGGDPRRVKYLAYDAGGKAMAGLLSGEAHVLSTGFSEALALAEAGEVRILAMTGEERSAAAPEVPTLQELGYDASFVNWRGFFGAPGLPQAKVDQYVSMLDQMYQTQEWATVRDRNGWAEAFKPGPQFVAFLEQQEKVIGDLMRELGFLQ